MLAAFSPDRRVPLAPLLPSEVGTVLPKQGKHSAVVHRYLNHKGGFSVAPHHQWRGIADCRSMIHSSQHQTPFLSKLPQ